MLLGGFIKSSLVDYPGRVAAVVFTQGCNFRCPFCHNRELVIPSLFKPALNVEEVISFLIKRKGILQGVVVTGGEPTLQEDLADFLKKIKALGYLIKLDTNGSHPEVLSQLISSQVVDYVAMDIKAAPEHYPAATGVEVDFKAIAESITLLRRSKVEYEFRTTLVLPFCPPEDLSLIAGLLKDSPRYTLQKFVSKSPVVEPALLDKRQYTEEEYEDLKRKWQRAPSGY